MPPEDDDDPSPADTEPPRGRAALGVAVGAAIVFALLSLGLTVLLVSKKDDASTKERTEVALRATAVVEALATHDPSQPDTGRATIERYANQTVLGIYDAALEGITAAFKETGLAAKLQIDETYVGDINRGEVDVALIGTVVITPKDGTTRPPQPGRFFRVHLVKLNGEWKVDNVEFSQLTAAGAAGSGSPATATTSTSAPPIVTPTSTP
ncbi:MAG: hypothetical protein QOJ67_3186 [Acidimicrobiaceae bacterium]